MSEIYFKSLQHVAEKLSAIREYLLRYKHRLQCAYLYQYWSGQLECLSEEKKTTQSSWKHERCQLKLDLLKNQGYDFITASQTQSHAFRVLKPLIITLSALVESLAEKKCLIISEDRRASIDLVTMKMIVSSEPTIYALTATMNQIYSAIETRNANSKIVIQF